MITSHLKLYKSLNKNKVKYLIIGGVACGIYGSPRATFDIDIFIDPNLSNAQRLLKALKEAGFGMASLTTPEKILSNEVNVFKDYLEIDIFTKPKGIAFHKAWLRKEVRSLKGVRIKLVSIDDLMRSKSASNRQIDKEDIKILKQLKKLS